MKKTACIYILLYFILNISITAQNKKGNIYVLVVGVSEYSNPSDNLAYPKKDAIEVYNLFSKQTTPSKTKLLTNQSATHRNILVAARQLFTNTKSEDIVIFYFSGHGYKGGFAAHDAGLPYSDLKKIFKQTKAKRKIIFADACYSGDIRGRKTNRSDNSIKVGNDKVCLFLSSRSNQTSMESSLLKNGSFTYFLIDGLKGKADTDRNNIITAREIFNFVNPKVKQYSNGEQVPVMWGKFDNKMEILNWNK